MKAEGHPAEVPNKGNATSYCHEYELIAVRCQHVQASHYWNPASRNVSVESGEDSQ